MSYFKIFFPAKKQKGQCLLFLDHGFFSKSYKSHSLPTITGQITGLSSACKNNGTASKSNSSYLCYDFWDKTYQQHFFCDQALRVVSITISIIVVITTKPIQVCNCQVNAVEHNGCQGKENSEKIQNHVEDDLKKGKF